jgi:hypothetical protein
MPIAATVPPKIARQHSEGRIVGLVEERTVDVVKGAIGRGSVGGFSIRRLELFGKGDANEMSSGTRCRAFCQLFSEYLQDYKDENRSSKSSSKQEVKKRITGGCDHGLK